MNLKGHIGVGEFDLLMDGAEPKADGKHAEQL